MASLPGLAVCQWPKADGPKCFRFILRLTPYALLLSLLFVSAAGAGWVRQTSNTTLSLRDVCFVDSLFGWAVGGFDDPTPTPSRGICLKTTDGGDTWTMVYDTSGRSMMLSLSFVDRNRGWMMGDSSFSLGTTDGGSTWSVLSEVGYYYSAFALRFVNDTLGYVVGGSYFGGIMEGSALSRSTNGGASWTWFGHYRYGQWLYALDVNGPRWAWTLGRYDTLFRTTDAGNSWQSRPFPFPTRYFNGLAFCDTNLGIAVSRYQTSIIRTSDGGVTWNERPCPTTRSLTAAEMSGPLNAWACGDSGTIIASTDGGMNWTAQVSGTRVQLRKIWFVDDRQGWAVGDSGVILHTEDGGRSGVWDNPQGSFQPLTSNISFSVVPNPFVSFTSVPGHSSNRFALYDISGRRVGVYKGDRIGEGLTPGVYFLRPEGQGGKLFRVVKIR